MSDTKREDWSKPAAMAIPKGGYFVDKVEQGRYGPIFPKSPAGYGFSVLAKIIPGREEVFYKYAKTIEETIAAQPDALAVLQLHYLRWVLFPINGETYFMYQGIFDTDFDKYTEDAVKIFSATGLRTVFENLQGFPMDWQTNPAAFIKFAPRSPMSELPRICGIPVCERHRNQEGSQGEGRALNYARPDAVIAGDTDFRPVVGRETPVRGYWICRADGACRAYVQIRRSTIPGSTGG